MLITNPVGDIIVFIKWVTKVKTSPILRVVIVYDISIARLKIFVENASPKTETVYSKVRFVIRKFELFVVLVSVDPNTCTP